MKKIIINDNSWQTRIAITRDGKLQNIYFSGHAEEKLERAFFKGKVTKVLPGIQTAFIEIGQEKAGFLHISEIDRELAIRKISKTTQLEDVPKKERRQKRLDISKILKEGDPILVQVSKEPVYEKGAKLTTCFTLPGRFLVLMPNIPRIGVSKKIEDREERARLKDIIREHLPEGMGAIIRTTSQGSGKRELIKDLNFLVKNWENIQQAFKAGKTKDILHQDIDLSLQIVRDHLDEDVDEVITDTKQSQQELYKFVRSIAPEFGQRIKLYTGQTPIFDYFGLEKQIEQALDKKVFLKSGGSLIIETTEAMTVIDVNTGRFTGKTSLEDTILKTNLEAAQEVARQLRLRNIGGLIVIDFIDMSLAANKQKLFRFFEKMLKERDKFQSVVLKISEFGLVQMTRKRSGKTLIQQLMETCPTCHGLGVIKSLQTNCYHVLRLVKQELLQPSKEKQFTIRINPRMFEYITSKEYNAILGIEKGTGKKITLVSDQSVPIYAYKIEK